MLRTLTQHILIEPRADLQPSWVGIIRDCIKMGRCSDPLYYLPWGRNNGLLCHPVVVLWAHPKQVSQARLYTYRQVRRLGAKGALRVISQALRVLFFVVISIINLLERGI